MVHGIYKAWQRDSINFNLKVPGTNKESSQNNLGVKINNKRAASKHQGDAENRVQIMHRHSAAQNAVVPGWCVSVVEC